MLDIDEFVPEVPIDSDPGTANSVLEDAAPGTYTGLTAFARDRDATSEVNDYEIDDPRFAIDAAGVVTVSGTGVLNHETEPSVDVTVTPLQIFSSGTIGRKLSSTFTIAIADANEPIESFFDGDFSRNEVAENAPPGTPVGISLFATDTDLNQSISFELGDNVRFVVVDEGGAGVVRTTSSAVFNSLSEPAITLPITAVSSDGSRRTESFQIDVTAPTTPVGPLLDSDVQPNKALVDGAAGRSVGISLRAIDPDPGSAVTYEILTDGFALGPDGRTIVTDGTSLLSLVPFSSDSRTITLAARANSNDGTSSIGSFPVEIIRRQQIDLQLDTAAVDEGESTTGSVFLDVAPAAPFVVTFSASPSDELGLPASVTIPAGKTGASFTLQGSIDFVSDGDVTVEVVAAPAVAGSTVESAPQEIIVRNVPQMMTMVPVIRGPSVPSWSVNFEGNDNGGAEVPSETESVQIIGFGVGNALQFGGGGRSGAVNEVRRGSVVVEIDRKDGPETDLVVTLSGGLYDNPDIPFDAESFVLDYDPETDLTTLTLAEAFGGEAITGTAGPDALAVPDFDVLRRVDGLDGRDSLMLPASLEDTTIAASDGGFEIRASEGLPLQAQSIETFLFEDNTLAVDNSAEAVALARIYSVSLDRDYDLAGMTFWREALDAGLTLVEVALSFLEGAEYGALGGDTLDDSAFLTRTYDSGFDRSPDDAGFAYWSNLLQSGAVGREDVIVGFATSTEMDLRDDATAESGVLLLA